MTEHRALKNNLSKRPRKHQWRPTDNFEVYPTAKKYDEYLVALEAELQQMKKDRCGNTECDHDCPICFDDILGKKVLDSARS